MIAYLPTKRILSAIIVANISQSFTYKMASKINWHGYVTIRAYYVTVTLCMRI